MRSKGQGTWQTPGMGREKVHSQGELLSTGDPLVVSVPIVIPDTMITPFVKKDRLVGLSWILLC